MEFHQLRYFVAVARFGSFVRASEEEGVAQPSLSQQIRKLEGDLGVALFDRLGRTVRLTQYGRELLPRAEEILRGVTEARHRVEGLNCETRGRLVVGSIPTILPYWLAPRAAQFQKLAPEAQIEFREDQTQRLVKGLQAGEIDVAVLALPVANPDIVCCELFREPLLAAVPRGHPLAGAAEVELSRMKQERMLLLREGHCLRDEVLTACHRAKAQFATVFESDQLSSIFAMVEAGLGISLVPAMAAGQAGGCVLVPMQKRPVRRVGYARARGHFVSPLQKRYVQWLKEVASVIE